MSVHPRGRTGSLWGFNPALLPTELEGQVVKAAGVDPADYGFTARATEPLLADVTRVGFEPTPYTLRGC